MESPAAFDSADVIFHNWPFITRPMEFRDCRMPLTSLLGLSIEFPADVNRCVIFGVRTQDRRALS